MFAMQMGQALGDAVSSAEVNVVDLYEVTSDSLKAMAASPNSLTVFITACFGRGEPTDSAKKIYAYVMDPANDGTWMAGAQFAVFGLGSSQVRVLRL